MTTTNLLICAVTASTATLTGWGNLAYHAGRGSAMRAGATRVLLDYTGSERRRFQLVNTLLAVAIGSLLVPIALRGWARPIPTGLAVVGLGCLALVLGWLTDFALRPLQIPTQQPTRPPATTRAGADR